MSNTVSVFLKRNPLLVRYAQEGLINLNALARYIKESDSQIDKNASLAAVGMDLRRYISKLPKASVVPFDFSKYPLQVVARTNINELILNKNIENRSKALSIINRISKTKYFISIVEGEKEMVVMTDYPLQDLLKVDNLKNYMTHYTDQLSFISVNFPIELRLVPGIYNVITSSLAEANVSIHSFHTIGGEILILVRNNDLLKTQEILQSLLTHAH